MRGPIRYGLLLVFVSVSLVIGATMVRAETPPQPTKAKDGVSRVVPQWTPAIESELRRREYFATGNERGLQSPNRAQGFRTYYVDAGVRLVLREASEQPLGALRLRAFGRAEQSWPAALEPPIARDDSVAQRGQHGLSVAYTNTPGGLQLRWELFSRPRAAGPLALVFDLDAAALRRESGHVVLESSSARNLILNAFEATDGGGRALATSVELDGTQLTVSVLDATAQYPIALKTLIQLTPDRRLQVDQIGARFGFSVAAVDDLDADNIGDLLVGAPDWDGGSTNEGALFVFTGSASGPLPAPAYRLESDQSNARLGYSVAGAADLDGNSLGNFIAGAPGYDAGQNNEGAVFVYDGLDLLTGALTPRHILQLNVANAGFGSSVAGGSDLNGDGIGDLIAGAPGLVSGTTLGGRVAIYFGVAAGAAPVLVASVSSFDSDAALGASADMAGDLNGDGFGDIVIGIPNAFDGPQAQVFFGAPGAGFNTSVRGFLNRPAGPVVGFASRVAGVGDINGDGFADLAVSAPTTNLGQVDEGVVYLYFGAAGAAFNPAHDAVLQADQAGAEFGAAVAAAGDFNGDGYGDVVVGAPRFDTPLTDAGQVRLYLGGPGAFDTTADLTLNGGQVNSEFGRGLGRMGDFNNDGFADLAVGAELFDDQQSDEGVVFIYNGGVGATLDSTPDWQPTGSAVNDRFGAAVAGAGDLNADGYSDVVVGAPQFDGGQTDEGAAFVFYGAAGGLAPTPAVRIEIDAPLAQFGAAVSGGNDFNGDRYADLVVGAPFFTNGQIIEGGVFIYYGGPLAINTVADGRLESDRASAQFGYRVASIGDTDGDGYSEVMVSSLVVPGGSLVYVFRGGAGAFDVVADRTLMPPSPASAELFGNAIAAAGDVNGDGFADAVIGDPQRDFIDAGTENFDQGAACIYLGGPSSLGASPNIVLRGFSSQMQFGTGVAGIGDFTGDGYSDLAVGAPYYNNAGAAEAGMVVLFAGGPGLGNDRSELPSSTAGERLGLRVAAAGDLNGDGYADVVASASQANPSRLQLYWGGPSTLDPESSSMTQGLAPAIQYGAAIAGAGDVNGDGFADLIVGAPVFSGAITLQGTVFGYLGNVQAGRNLAMVQIDRQPWGTTDTFDSFGVRSQLLGPRGRERAQLEIEACPPGAPYASSSCRRGRGQQWLDIGATANGVTQFARIGNLALDTHYHWRARTVYASLTPAPLGNAFETETFGPWRSLEARTEAAGIRTQRPQADQLFVDGFE